MNYTTKYGISYQNREGKQTHRAVSASSDLSILSVPPLREFEQLFEFTSLLIDRRVDVLNIYTSGISFCEPI